MILLGTSNFFTLTSYESGSSRIAQVQYFSGYVVKYVYDSGSGYPDAGYLRQIVAPNSNNLVLWQAVERDQDLHLVQSEAGNNLVQQTQVYDPLMGRLTNTCASNDSQLPNCDGDVANFQYDWDNIGRLSDRIDYLAGTGGLTEYFCYDGLYRLTDVGGYGQTNTCDNGNHTNISYDAIGNISQKTDTGIYTTPPPGAGSVLPHAVSSVTVCSGCTVDGIPGGDTINFDYDGNGNLNCETTAGQCDTSAINRLFWTSFNRPSSIVHEGATTLGYSGACPPARLGRDRRNPEHNRVEMSAPGVVTKYLSDPASGVMTEHMGPTVTPYVDRDYIMADGHMVAIIVTQNSSTTSIYYPILDHLGSVAVIVDGNVTLPNGNANPNYGDAIDRYSYDAWGEARDPGQWTPRTCSDGPQPPFVRGFTGQEQLPAGVCLTNFNARIYNPAIGRFFSADPTVEAPYNPQDLNRYSYVLNDPTLFTDPTGLCFLGCFWQSPIFDDILELAVAVVFQQYELTIFEGVGESAVFAQSAVGAIVNAGIIGGVAGAISTGTLQGAALGALQAGMFAEAGNLLAGPDGIQIYGSHDAAALVAHGFVGGLVSVASGQNFESGFLAGGVSSLADIGEFQTNNFAANVVEHAVLGGLGSILGGGKFENGAVTGAFSYLFNTCMHQKCWASSDDLSALATGGPYAFWSSMCAGGDPIACVAADASANAPDPLTLGTVGKLWLETNYAFYNNGAQMTPQIEMEYSDDIANLYVYYVGTLEAGGTWPSWIAIDEIHWSVNAQFNMPPSAYPGTPLGIFAPDILKSEICPECAN